MPFHLTCLLRLLIRFPASAKKLSSVLNFCVSLFFAAFLVSRFICYCLFPCCEVEITFKATNGTVGIRTSASNTIFNLSLYAGVWKFSAGCH